MQNISHEELKFKATNKNWFRPNVFWKVWHAIHRQMFLCNVHLMTLMFLELCHLCNKLKNLEVKLSKHIILIIENVVTWQTLSSRTRSINKSSSDNVLYESAGVPFLRRILLKVSSKISRSFDSFVISSPFISNRSCPSQWLQYVFIICAFYRIC